ncbi:DNA polymerase III subunit delta' [Aliiroseovarius sp. YM-037]|uniref:DNA polymerase III subunit delta' n=1 Tax=Aliiroseovarius sp. YM-037 TaxID=3341728 RepID=UPI003A7F70DA
MKDGSPNPESDRVEGAPHPRETKTLFGHTAAEDAFLDAYRSDRLHHAWLISGPRGVGKATLAWRIARFLLATPIAGETGLFDDATEAPTTLSISPDHPVAARTRALSEPRLHLMRTPWDDEKNRFKQGITVDETRALRGFFSMSAADGGRRVVIVDAADDMNVNAANALLKLLEEPPENATLLLVSHQPTGLLPTIRSRCRTLRLSRLSPDDMARALSAADLPPTDDTESLAALADGSVGEAIRLLNLDGLKTYKTLVDLFATSPGLDRPKLISLAESVVGAKAVARYDLLLGLIELFLSRLARAGVTGPMTPAAAPGEAELLARLSPSPAAGRAWAEIQQSLSERVRHGRAVNLDPASLILDMGFSIDATAAKWAAR